MKLNVMISYRIKKSWYMLDEEKDIWFFWLQSQEQLMNLFWQRPQSTTQKNWNTPSEVLLAALYRFWSLLQGVPDFSLFQFGCILEFWTLLGSWSSIEQFCAFLDLWTLWATKGTLSTSGHCGHFWVIWGSFGQFWLLWTILWAQLGTFGRVSLGHFRTLGYV